MAVLINIKEIFFDTDRVLKGHVNKSTTWSVDFHHPLVQCNRVGKYRRGRSDLVEGFY